MSIDVWKEENDAHIGSINYDTAPPRLEPIRELPISDFDYSHKAYKKVAIQIGEHMREVYSLFTMTLCAHLDSLVDKDSSDPLVEDYRKFLKAIDGYMEAYPSLIDKATGKLKPAKFLIAGTNTLLNFWAVLAIVPQIFERDMGRKINRTELKSAIADLMKNMENASTSHNTVCDIMLAELNNRNWRVQNPEKWRVKLVGENHVYW